MSTTTENTKPTKKKGPIRWEAIIPFLIICVLTSIYMKLFFDLHLRKALEFGGYQVLGSEVNISSLETSFAQASIKISKIELTSSDRPTHNSLEIGEVRFAMLWDALLRGKIVINEIAVEQIKFNTQRARPGNVKPPEPPKTGPSMTDQLKAETLALVQKEYEDNALGNVAAILGGDSTSGQLAKIEGALVSKEALTKFESALKSKQAEWQKRIAELPQAQEATELGNRLQKVQYKDFKTPQELEKSLKELDAIFKETDSKIKQLQSAERDFKSDYKSTELQLKEVESLIKKDIQDLQAHFKIPQLDAAALSKAVFMKYLSPYLGQMYQYQGMAEKYLPPKFTQKSDKEEKPEFQPRPRAQGVVYEFGKPNSYPLVWIKRVAISSQAGMSAGAGNIKGEITHITSHPRLIGLPTVLNVAGGFPANQIEDLLLKVSLDISKSIPLMTFKMAVGSYPLEGKELVNTKDIQLNFSKAQGRFGVEGKLVDFKELDYRITNEFSNLQFAVESPNSTVKEIVSNVMAGIPQVNLEAWGQGVLPKVPFNIKSNLGSDLAKGFEKQLQGKIDEAKKKIQAYVDEQIGAKKKEADQLIAQYKNQAEGEIKKLQAQFDSQKKAIEDRTNQAKKDAENKAKAELNDNKKKLESEAKKKAEELKKKLGF